MADERWDQIHGRRYTLDFPEKRVEVPFIEHPRCPDHCSGRHDEEAVIACPACRVIGYVVTAHGWFHNPASYFYTHEPRNGMPAWTGRTPRCQCGREMVRRWR